MKKSYRRPVIEVVEVERMDLLAGSDFTKSPNRFLDDIQDDILIDSPLNIL